MMCARLMIATLAITGCYGNYDVPLVVYEPRTRASCDVPEDVDAGTETVVEVPQDAVGEGGGDGQSI